MAIDPSGGPSTLGPTEYTLLQQELVSVRARLDRQVQQLIRLNHLSDELLHQNQDRLTTNGFVEAILDVLDVAVGAVWVFPPHVDLADAPFAVGGASQPDAMWADVGVALAHRLGGHRRARWLDPETSIILPDLDLVDALACRCVDRNGECIAVILAANHGATAAMFDPVGTEAGEVLTLLAEKLAVHFDHARDRRLLDENLTQLRESEARLELVLRGSNDGWWDWDLRQDLCYLSGRFHEMTGSPITDATVIKGFWRDLVVSDDRDVLDAELAAALRGDTDSVELELRIPQPDGDELPVLARGTVTRDATGQPIRFAGSLLDVSERKRHEESVQRLAFYDPLTDLPNRRLLLDRVRELLISNANAGVPTAVLMLDLDRFKVTNDTHGHGAGDELLRHVARRLEENVRGDDTVARLSGDEFVVLLHRPGRDVDTARESARVVAEHLLAALDEPYALDAGTVHHSASIGVAVCDDPGMGEDVLLDHADVALYAAKRAGRNTVCFFLPEMQRRADRRTALEVQLRRGISRGELHLVYQPQVDHVGRLVGAEALLRWEGGDEGPVPTPEFIPIAEESGLIHEIGLWSLREVARQVVEWRSSLPPGFRVAFNLSAPEFLHPEMPERIMSVLDETGLRGTDLRLEITESTVLTHLDDAIDRMNRLRRLGVEFSLDDFGSGYSSLTYLRHLPIREVKIDRSYVNRFLHDHRDAAIVQAIITLSRSMDFRVIAEGVEHERERLGLIAEGCRYFQGYLLGRPRRAGASPGDLLRPEQ